MPTTDYLWDPIEDNVIAEFDEGGAVVAEYTTEPEEYGNIVSQHRDGETNCFYSDGLGSTTEVTDAVGEPIATHAYSAFGETSESSGDLTNPVRYAGASGYYFDSELECYYIRRRQYSPAVARWTSQDPIASSYLRSRYSYVQNQPLRRIDPSGLLCYDTAGYESHGCPPNDAPPAPSLLYKWNVEWTPAPDETNGFVIQRVTRFYLLVDCALEFAVISRPFDPTKPDGSTELISPLIGIPIPTATSYWELWTVKNKKLYRGKPPNVALSNADEFTGYSFPGSFGFDRIYGEAFFISRELEKSDAWPGEMWPIPPLGWDAWKVYGTDYPSKLLAARPAFPIPIDLTKYTAIKRVLIRSHTSAWMCCGDCRSAFTIRDLEIGRCS